MDNKKLLGKRIKELRKSEGLTQKKLAELISIEKGSLSAIESGRHFPSMPTAERIANVLKIELKALFIFKHHLPIEIMKKDIIKNLDKLTTDNIVFIHSFVDGYK